MYLNRIVRIERNGHGTLDILQTGIPFPSKISVYNADTISQGTNDCVMILNGGCPDDKLCVPVPNGISCVNITGDELPTCGGDIVVYDGSSVTLTSPNYPNNYNNEDDCEWIVKAYPGGYIHVRSTHFNTEECCDFLHIGYGDHEAVTQSGFQYQYVEWTSPVSTIWIRWNSDSSVTGDGWALVLTHTYSSPSASPYPCPEGYAPCWNNAECYPSYEQCNDNCYCSDCSDENNCSPSASPYPCPEGYMSCWYTDECYPSYEHCNNNCYCSDCSDENNCYAPTTIPPPMCGYGCLNGGYCSHSYDNYYTCSCPIDYTGMFCETEIKHCEDVDVMCLNGGTCMYDSCYCPAGYTGSLCETELFDCNMFGCFSGNCTTYGYCICWPGYTGHLCETVLPTCDSCSPFAHCDYAPCECICTDYNCTNQYQCMNNQCIPWSEYCDGNNDCLDGSDEWYCYPVSTPSPYCPAFHSPCSNYIECVPNEAMCNGTAECSDKSDEFNCGCGGSNHIPNGKTFVMTSPGYPDNYGNNDLCYWYISADAGATISIHFDYFDTESNFDFISIGYGLDPYDISTRVIYQSGSVAPDDWLSPTSNIWISWDSDGSFYQKGWVLSVTAREACTESINLGINEVVSITSPNYPLPYDDLIDCVWIVQADPTRAIDVHFIAFNTNYDEDYFSGGFGDDPDDLSTQAFIYSGDVSPPDWNSESTLIWLRFTTDGSNTNTGFHIDLKDDFYCENIGIPQCVNHLPYGGSTFYSHLGLSREQAMKQMDNLTDIDGCHAHIELFMCSLLSPECGINGTYRQPCKTFCQDVEYACAEVYVLNGYDWPINCEDMPTKNERYDCVRVTPCMSNPCVHGGTCLPVDEDRSTCACSHGYTGEFCELEIDECSSNPCENGGICIDMLADYTCVCHHGWGGTRCDCRDITVETCRDMPLSMARLSKYTSGSDRSGNIQALVNFLDNMRYNRAGTPCHEHMDLFMCALFAPECSEEGLYRPPCMHFCDQVKTSCETKFNTGGIAWPIDCDLLPHTNDSSVCIGIPTVNDLCGSAPAESNRIVGGSAASLGTHPWQVSIHEHSAHNCGAVLIDSNWIVTAAHCVYSSSVSNLELRMGFTSLSAGSVHEYRTPVSAMYIHPSYSTTFNQYDFAMLYVETPIIFTDYIRPICLPPDGNDAFFADGDVCVITGWGQLSETSYGTPDVLQEAVVPIVNQGTCNDRYGGDISSSMICAAYLDTGGIDTCYGDSGGPLVSQKTDGRWYLAGLTSWGRGGCASSYYPGVYSRVTEGIAWMNEIMASEP
uniref:Uncharacterized protein LOC100375209 n=1 Tax=Saccoglossus kowalevskii TaxID=10224 RepID=A0ABM0M2Y3_SACKO|nr:PREDICTED: uncharacterized protein LOC100375209 [Saccoglossus kowalevskii]